MTTPDTDTLAGLLAECTPGPWFTGSHYPERGIWIGGRDRHDGGAVLPYLYFGHTINWPKNYESNARLIALAPELAAETIALRAQAARIERLEAALREILNCGQSAEPDHWKFRCMARETARAALEGRE